MVYETVSAMISKQLKVEPGKITGASRLVEDLGADSANVMVLIMDVEDKFNIMVEDDAINTLKTVDDVVTDIASKQ